MSIKTFLIGTTAAGIALGSLGLAASEASAAVMIKKPMHSALVCKVGYVRHHVKIHGKWRWECVRVHHHPMAPKPMLKKT
jgi:hypothetical protein